MIFPIAAITVVLVFCVSFSVAAPGVGPTGASLEDIKYAGSGCPTGATHLWHSGPDWANLTFALDDYLPTPAPGAPPLSKRKNCNINAKIHVPPGYQYTLYEHSLIGNLYLSDKVKFTHQADYWFAGLAGKKARFFLSSYGPQSSYNIADTLVDSALVWSPCGGVGDGWLNISAQAYTDNSANPAPWLKIDVQDLIQMVYYLQWRKC